MSAFTSIRDRLRSGEHRFIHLDAAQLVKHAFGLVTEGRRSGKSPTLLYLYAEPKMLGGALIGADKHTRHRTEIDIFRRAVDGAEVRFVACSYRDWLARWTGETRVHADALIARFKP